MKVKKIFAVLLAVVMICACAASCSLTNGGHSDSIVGKWKNIDSKESSGDFIFKEDGTLTIEGLGYVIDCTYKVDGNNLHIDYLNTVYTDYSGKQTNLGNGFFSGFNEKEKKAGGVVTSLQPFDGEFVIYEASNQDYLEIFLIDPDSEEVMTVGGKDIKGVEAKWRYERSYEKI